MALVAACALALAGCGGGDGGDPPNDARPLKTPATATATATPSGSPTPEASPTPEPSPSTEPSPTVTLPDLTGRTMGAAVLTAKPAHVDFVVRLQGTGKRATSWGIDEEICEQSGGPGTVTFTVPRDGRDCDGRLLRTQKATPAPQTAPPDDDTGGTGSGSGSGACELMSPAGNCYADGQFCAKKHRGLSTHGRGGEYLTCRQDSGGVWRWSDGVPG